MNNLQFTFFVGACLLVTVQAFVCSPSIFVELSSGKYYFSPIKASWIDSWRFCRLHEANLVSIETPEEQQALVEYIKTSETSLETTQSTTTVETPITALVNLALKKAASQSSTTRSPYGASHAVDGVGFGCNCAKEDCSHTSAEDTPWWQVDLGNDYKVYVVSIHSIAEKTEFLHDFEVRIGATPAPNHGSNTLCGQHAGGIGNGFIYNMTCEPGPISGRYVTMQITQGTTNNIILCEVLVLGEASVHTTESTRPTTKSTTTAVDSPSVSYWTSGINIFQVKKWIWMSTGKAIGYRTWCRNAPDNYLDGENCLLLNFEEVGCWNDYNCTSDDIGEQEIHFICEVGNMVH